MTERPDDNAHLTDLLRRLPTPEPSAGFVSAARRRYLAALEARARREALTGLAAALIGLAAIALSLATVMEPVALVAWLAESVADLARWTAGIGVLLALVPPTVWDPIVLGSAAMVLLLALIAQARSVALAK